MSDHRQRIDPITAEQLLSGARGVSHVGSDPIAGVLAAAATSARGDELAGEEAAVMAFRSARLAIAPESRRRSMLKTALAKAATAKAAVVIAAVAGGGGVALAATSGHLPGVTSSDHHPTGRPTTSVTASAHAMASAATHAPSSASEHAPGTPNGSPSPNLRGLCTAFSAGVGDNPGKALDNPAFRVLITTAGGKDKVADFCTTLVGTRPAKPSTHPSGDASSHGAPSSHASDKPTSHPSGPTGTPSHPMPTPPTTHGH